MERFKSKVDIIYEALLSDISNGRYKSGERLVISKISKEKGVSDIPVREAVRLLESEGYVQINANQGPIVSDFSPEKLNEIFQIKAVLEGYAARLACERLTETDLQELAECNAEFCEAFQAGDAKKCGELNKKFHLRMYRDIKERELVFMIEELWRKYSITKMVFSLSPDRTEGSVREHEQILELLRQRKTDEVEMAVRAHKLMSGKRMEEQLKRREAERR